jgi:hypothetical protein
MVVGDITCPGLPVVTETVTGSGAAFAAAENRTLQRLIIFKKCLIDFSFLVD